MSERRVLFICTGNTCRGPMAEGIFNQMTEHLEGAEVKCASAGISAVKGQRVTRPGPCRSAGKSVWTFLCIGPLT